MNKPLNNKLRDLFILDEGKALKRDHDNLVFYLALIDSYFHVGIPYNEKKLDEKFVGTKVKTETINYDGTGVECISIVAKKDSVDKEQLLLIAEDFVSKAKRKAILEDPYSWIDSWRTFFGDSIKKKMIYDVLGELISFKNKFKSSCKHLSPIYHSW